jgi:5-(carboxyamino)imidazole ribonucleotide synthase
MKIGILGGGQLARMMALRGAELGLEVSILSEKKNDPAAQVVQNWQAGSIDDTVAVQRFFSSVDAVTFESEFINTKKLESKLNSALLKKVQPTISCVGTLQDRTTQKTLITENKIPTAPFIASPDQLQLKDFFNASRAGIVCKKRTNGYDGYGTFLLRSDADLARFISENSKDKLEVTAASSPQAGGKKLITSGHFDGDEFIAEDLIGFQRELAISAVRDMNGHILWTPLIEWKARDNKCWWVKGPIKHKSIEKLKRSLSSLLQKINYIGFISFELFDSKKGLIVNEIAPRVHNSAHYTLNATTPDQFQLHLLATAGLSLKKVGAHNSTLPLTTKSFAMVNLIGREMNELGQATTEASLLEHKLNRLRPLIAGSGFLHWYNKDIEKPGRKMGHINVCSPLSADKALKKALQLEKEFFNEFNKK